MCIFNVCFSNIKVLIHFSYCTIYPSKFLLSLVTTASCVWDPHEALHIQTLEKVQQQAARWVLSDYGRQSSITRILTQLGWLTLQHCRFISRLIFFTKLFMKLFPILFLSTQYPTRQHHSKHFVIPSNLATAYQKNFYPRTVRN